MQLSCVTGSKRLTDQNPSLLAGIFWRGAAALQILIRKDNPRSSLFCEERGLLVMYQSLGFAGNWPSAFSTMLKAK